MASYTYIDRALYNSLNRQFTNVTSAVNAAKDRVNSAKDNYSRVNSQVNSETTAAINNINRSLERTTDDIYRDMERISDETRLAIGRLRVEHNQQIQGIKDDISLANRNIQQVGSRIDSLAAEHDRKMREIARNISAQKDRGVFYRNMLTDCMAQLSELHPDKLAPEDYSFLNGLAEFIEDDIKTGDYQAAIALAQQAVVDAQRLRISLELMNQDFERLSNEISGLRSGIDSTIDTYKKPEKNRVRLGKPYEDAGEEFDGDIVHWAQDVIENLFSMYYNECNQLDNEFVPNMDIDNMETALDAIKPVPEKLEGCRVIAHDEFYVYDRVCDMMSNIHNALTRDESWTLSSSGFSNEDNRLAYTAVYKPHDGEHAVTVMVLPNRPVARRTKTRRGETVEYGPVQVRINTTDSNGRVDDKYTCEDVRQAVLSRLESDGVGIDFDELRRATAENTASEVFISRANAEGSKSRESRLVMAGEKLGIT